MPVAGIRQGRLRNGFAAWYPTIGVSTWIPAKTLARKVVEQLLGSRRDQRAETPRWEPGPRILGERHFFFRGGRNSRPSGVRTRAGDRPEGAQTRGD